MKLITSGDNQIYKAAALLKQKKYRDEQNQYLIEGPNLIREAQQNGGRIERILRSEDFTDEQTIREGIDPALADLETAVLSTSLFRKLSDTETPQGILAVVKKREFREDEFFTEQSGTGKSSTTGNVLVLDRLQDPGNIGTILRTADAAGYLGAILMKGTADIYSPKIVRAAAGSLFRLPVLYADDPGDAVRLLKRYGKTIISTSPMGSMDYFDADLREHAAVVIGNEGNGVCREFLEDADILVKIPMEGTIESLNAAVSAGILMYESVRQRHRE
jgi:TrmH family RNA methyltransferase